MKKLKYLVVAFGLTLGITTSCDVTHKPYGVELQKPFTSVDEAVSNKEALYSLFRSMASVDNVGLSAIQSDLYNLTAAGTDLKYLYQWDLNSLRGNRASTDSYYASAYSVILRANYLIDHIDEYMKNGAKKADFAELNRIKAEACTIRAYADFLLVQRYSNKRYDKNGVDNDEKGYQGICLVTKYNPLNRAPRVSMKKSYASINSDLDFALNNIKSNDNMGFTNNGIPYFITHDYVLGLKARVALNMKDWANAAKYAEELINTGRYPLTDIDPKPADSEGEAAIKAWRTKEVEKLNHIYKYEDSPEIVCMLFASNQIGGMYSGLFCGAGYGTRSIRGSKFDRKTVLQRMPVLIPTQQTVNMFTQDPDDLRQDCYIGRRHTYIIDYQNGTSPQDSVWLITKFDGNPQLNRTSDRQSFVSHVHLFNIAEAYLILAEAEYEMGNQPEALATLQKLLKARGYQTVAIQQSELLDRIRLERAKELIGEGQRLNDLFRWKLPVNRGPLQSEMGQSDNWLYADEQVIISSQGGNSNSTGVNNEAWVWEFPKRDLEVNKSLANNHNWKF